MDTPGKRALYNNLKGGLHRVSDQAADYLVDGDPVLTLALRIDEAVRRVRPDDWRGHQAKENQIKREALLPLLGNDASEVERVFKIIFQQHEY